MTSKEINKRIKALTEEKENILEKEEKSAVFKCSVGEEEDRVRPSYDFRETNRRIDQIDSEVRTLKHKLNVFNTTTTIEGGMTVDEVLVIIPQLTKKKEKLTKMANRLKRERVPMSYSNTIVDYEITNYDTEKVKSELESVSEALDEYQMLLDKVNSTIEIE